MSHGKLGGIHAVAPQSRLYQGAFGRLFPELAAWDPGIGGEEATTQHFRDIANNEMIEEPVNANTENTPDPENELNVKIPAGYTYFGQFVDHDITFDPVSSLMRANDPNGLNNFRTPRLDLDNLYGRGPGATPHLYQKENKGKFLLSTVAGTELNDLPRNLEGTALIGDPRNDENRLVANIQVAFLRAHNVLFDRASGDATEKFETARRTLRWLYQHVVWNDFISRLVNEEIRNQALFLETMGGRKFWSSHTKSIYNWKHQPFMPVEFAVAAYRFGHSMVRNAYQTNINHGFNEFITLFDPGGDDLRGGSPMEEKHILQWDWFLDIGSIAPFPQGARKLDTKLSRSLANLPGEEENVLAFRNLLRGWRFGLPSGTAVAERLGFDPITIDRDHDSLWFYVLKEAEVLPGANNRRMLGKVGSAIVASTFAGLLRGDPQSYFSQKPGWTPDDDPILGGMSDDSIDGKWDFGSIIKIAGVPISVSDF